MPRVFIRSAAGPRLLFFYLLLLAAGALGQRPARQRKADGQQAATQEPLPAAPVRKDAA